MNSKTEKAYKTIGEVTKLLDLKKKNKSNPAYIVRFWEKQFKQVKPIVLNGNRRYYDQKNINILKKIKFLLKDQGMTIKGAKKVLDTNQSNILDEISNKSIRTDNLKNKLIKISKIIKELKADK
tara:strand:+ start:88 stop:459 length:372 start_codon:yes stop_codon:yes gene_type:complete